MKESIQAHDPRVLVLCQLFYPELISTGQTVTELCEKLSELGVEIEVICAPPTLIDTTSRVDAVLHYRGVLVRRLWATRFPKLWVPGRIVNQVTFALSMLLFLLFRRELPRALVFTNPPFLLPICALVSLLRKFDYTCVVFDVYPETLVSLGILSARNPLVWLMDRINRFALYRARKIVVIGRCMRRVIEAKLPARCSDRIESIHVWADDAGIKPIERADNSLIKEWNLQDKFVVLYAGNMGRFHDMETIMEAIRLLAQDVETSSKIAFVLAGEGHKKAWSEDFALLHGLPNVCFKSHLPREQLPFLLGIGDLALVCLSPGQEGLSVPSKTFAALSAGTPVVAVMAAESEIARMLEEQGCGLRIANGDSAALALTIKELCFNPVRLKAMRIRARKAIDERYSLELAARRYKEILV